MRRSERGYSLVETTLVLVLTGISASAALGGLRRVDELAALAAGRRQTVTTLVSARRRSYAIGRPVDVRLGAAATSLFIESPEAPPESRALPRGIRVASGPADGRVTFRPSGFADNATIRLASASGAVEIVVNQRGLVR